MHHTPGHLTAAKAGKELFAHSTTLMRTLLAAVFFLLLMQGLPAAQPSALHFVGVLPVYLLLGFMPVLLGMGLSLLLQGGLFASADLSQHAINSLALLLPLLTVHYTRARKLSSMTNGHHVRWPSILQLEATYYAGVIGMLGLWLLLSGATLPLAAWGMFAAACAAAATLEAAFSYSMLRLRKLPKHTARAYFPSLLRRTLTRSPSL